MKLARKISRLTISLAAMKPVFIIFLLIFCASVNAQTIEKNTIKPKDFDLACAVSSTIALGKAPANSSQWQFLYAATSFYLGRLSVHDDKTSWGAVVKSRIADKAAQTNSDELIPKCLELFSKKLE